MLEQFKIISFCKVGCALLTLSAISHSAFAEYSKDSFSGYIPDPYPVSAGVKLYIGHTAYWKKPGTYDVQLYGTSSSSYGDFTVPSGGLRWPSGGSERDSYGVIYYIRDHAFYGLKTLTGLTIGSNITRMDAPVCCWCSNLKYIKCTGGSTFSTVDGVLYSFAKDRLKKYPEGKAGESFTVPSSVKVISSYGMANTKLKTVVFSGAPPTFDANAFSGNGSMLGIGFPQGRMDWPGSVNGVPTFAIPSAVGNVSASKGTSRSSVTVTWSEHAVATSYKVYRSDKAGGTKNLLATLSGSTVCTDASAQPGVKYYYSVVAYNGPFASPSSAEVQGWAKEESFSVGYAPGLHGTGDSRSATKTQGVALTLEGAIFTRTGYAQTGWSTRSDGSTKDYELGALYTTDAAITLYPYWTATPKTYVVTFDLGEHGTRTGGGELTQTVAEGGAAVAPTVVVAEGWRWLGWSREFSNVTGNLTVLAQYEAEPQVPVGGTHTNTVNGIKWVYTIEDGVAILGYNPGDNFTPGPAAIPVSTTGKVVIPSSFEGCPLEKIGSDAFHGCANLTEIVMPDSVTEIGRYAFMGCCKLAKVELPPHLVRIKWDAFGECERLRRVEIPASVSWIDSNPFLKCTGLQDIVIHADNANYVSKDGIMLSKDGTTLIAFPGGRQEVSIPQGVTKLGYESFYGVATRRVSVPATIREMGTWVFGYSQIEEIEFDAAVSAVPSYACIYCSDLEKVVLHDGLGEIGESAFSSCSSLREVAIPASMGKIGDAAFRYCRTLSRVDFAGEPPADVAGDAFISVRSGCVGTYRAEHTAAWARVVDGNGMWKGLKMERAGDPPAPEPTTHTVTFVLGELGVRTGGGELTQTVEEGSAAVAPIFDVPPGWSFLGWSCDFSEVTSDLTVYAMYGGDPWMPPVDTLPDDGTYTQTVDGVEWVYTIEGGIAILGYKIGRTPGAAALRTDTTGSVTIPASFDGCPLQVIGPMAFKECTGITEIVIPESVRRIDRYAFSNCQGLTSVDIPEGVQSIGVQAFSGCHDLTWINFPSTLRTIDPYAFGWCLGLEYVEIPVGVTTIGEGAFTTCGYLETVVLPEGLTTISSNVFNSCCSLRTVTIPSTITKIEPTAFNACSNLGRVYVMPGDEERVSQLLSESGVDVSGSEFLGKTPEGLLIDHGLLIGFEGMMQPGEAVVVPDCVTGMVDYVFAGMPMGSVAISSSVKRISAYAFASCQQLNVVTLAPSIETVGDGAFSYCTGLGSIVLPAALKEFGHFALEGCSALREIAVMGGNSRYYSEGGVLYDRQTESLVCCPGGFAGELQVPEGVREIGYAACELCTSLKSVRLPAGVTNIGYGAFFSCTNLSTLVFDGNAPTVGERAFEGVPSSCTAVVRKGTSGWNVTIPGQWHGIKIVWCDESATDEQPMSVSGLGWHEVSFAVLPEGGDPADVFAPVEDKVGYVTYGSLNWNPLTGGTLLALEIGKGYWVQTTAESVEWTVTGQGNPGVEIALKEGWNLIGYPLSEEGEIETVLATALATDKIDFIYSGSRVYPGTLTTMVPGKGYWVYANAPVTIKFDVE